MDEASQPSTSITGAIRNLGLTLLRLLRARLELLSIELQEEKQQAVILFLLCGMVLVLGMMAALSLTLAVVLLCPDPVRPYVLAGFCLGYGALACLAWRSLRRHLRDRPKPWVATVDELKKDVEWLRSKS